ncbi:MAG: M14 family metallopeptidase [Candidatus Aminicenantes bacterium]|nr:M14 family metallopeptidase [Candidatus Aminicenantes bacterium]
MHRRYPVLMAAFTVLAMAAPALRPAAAYHKPEEVAAVLQGYAAKYPQLAKLQSLGKGSGGSDIWLLRLAAQPQGAPDPDARPGIFVAANIEGVHLIGTEAALSIAERLLSGYGKDKALTDLLDRTTVYIAPLLNPDTARQAFASPRWERWTNARAVDNDLDAESDEDGPEDLNKDGLITQMRVKDPEGKYIPDPKEPRLMRLADPKKGEKGIYALYTEGLDNDGDGEYNEDAAGGVEVNRNFPHDFEYDTAAAGLYPTAEAETVTLLKFLTGRGNIALVLNFSTENTILNQQQTGQAKMASDKVKVPKMMAGFLGLEPDTEYTIKEIVDILKGMNIGGGMEITEDMVAMFFGMGPAIAIDRIDQPLFDEIQKTYKDALKEAKLDYPEKRAKGVGKGSFAAFCYYQYGVPVFSQDLWAVPEPKKEPAKDALTADKLKAMSSDEFTALGEDKIDAFLKEQGAPPNFNAAMLLKMVKSGQVTPPKMAEMMEKMPKRPGGDGEEHPDAYLLNWSDAALNGKGFVAWTSFKHPTLGEVEIGGFIPYLKLNPPAADMEKPVQFGVDFYLKLMAKLPVLSIKETKVEALGQDLYRLTVFFANNGWFPTSTAQGRRAQTAWPITVRLKTASGQTLFSGRPIESIPFLEGSDGTRKLEWTVRGPKGSGITVSAWSPRLGTAEAKLVLK